MGRTFAPATRGDDVEIGGFHPILRLASPAEAQDKRGVSNWWASFPFGEVGCLIQPPAYRYVSRLLAFINSNPGLLGLSGGISWTRNWIVFGGFPPAVPNPPARFATGREDATRPHFLKIQRRVSLVEVSMTANGQCSTDNGDNGSSR